jgi:hypothetical protein
VSTNVRTDQATGVATRSPVGGSVRVNLLPEATKARDRASQQRGIAAVLAVTLFAGLGVSYWTQVRSLAAAEEELVAAEQVLAARQAERADLATYADLDLRLQTAEQRLVTALGPEVSVASVLQDVAAVTPSNTGLLAMTMNLPRPVDATEPRTVGSVNVSGQVTSGLAPGVERVLLEYDKIGAFDEPYFNSSAVDEDGVALFNLDFGLLPNARTERYADGLPMELQR